MSCGARRSTASRQSDAALLGRDVMTRKTPPVNVPASVRARLLKVAKERREGFHADTHELRRRAFPVSLVQVEAPAPIRPQGRHAVRCAPRRTVSTDRDLDLLGLGEATEGAVNGAVQEIVSTACR
jgi:hypothetical protein